MGELILTPFWIVTPDTRGPIGFGVTAFSLEDALSIIKKAGYDLPEDAATLRVTENVQVMDLEQVYVVPRMGPIVVRGLWYPFFKLGM